MMATEVLFRRCPALRRLENIQRGERVRYYRGKFHDDIARSEAKEGASQALNYAALLKSIKRKAEDLRAAGRLSLFEESVAVNVPGLVKPIILTDYIAVGE